jgi:hypothetical protein
MTKIAAKKFINAIVIFALFTGISFAFADGAPTPTHNPYETGLGDTLNMDTTLVIGAVLYGAGVIFTSSSKAILAKLGTSFIR